jgi:hypothetical protein
MSKSVRKDLKNREYAEERTHLGGVVETRILSWRFGCGGVFFFGPSHRPTNFGGLGALVVETRGAL